uniref:Asteroid homolog 1 n=1 Tax=Anabas testudineus TaxID=64144 RepID=A0A7N6BI14_ANATE
MTTPQAAPYILNKELLNKQSLLFSSGRHVDLSEDHQSLDENHGGEYAAFEDLIERFITALRDCEVTPYVVLDGGSDYTDKKLETLTRRAEDRIRKAHQAAVGGMKQHILPLLAKLVPVAQCYSEADQEIAALAREWQCPVLSNDSDFCIFELPAGLLPISYFRWEEVERSGSQRYIPCLSYSTSSFCIFFNIQPKLLPTFAALAGNDYVKLQRKGLSISWAQFDPTGRETPSRIEGLLCWLKAFEQPQEAVEAVLGMMGELSRKKKVEVQQSLWLGMQEYQLPPSSLKRFFIHGAPPPLPVVGRVPHWMCLPLTQARLTGDILDVLLLQRLSLNIPVEHADLPSACLTSRLLRQVMYGLLLAEILTTSLTFSVRNFFYLQIKSKNTHPTDAGTRESIKTQISTVSYLVELDFPSERLQVILEALGVTEESLKHLPPQLRLPVAVTCYWLQKAQPPPDQTLLKALLLGTINVPSGKYLKTLENHWNPKLDKVVTHSFNQWQICLKDSIHLNQLLGCPLPEPQIRMLAFIHKLHTQQTSMFSETQSKVRAPQQQQQRQPLDDLTAGLQQLFLQDNDEETATEVKSAVSAQKDLDLDRMLSVKTRYRTKERNNRCKNPEVARKEECRGWDLL